MAGLGPLSAFLLIWVRLGGVLLCLPGLGSRRIPLRMRIAFAALIALLVAPAHVGVTTSRSLLITQLAGELMLGLAFGGGVLLVATGIQLSGNLAAQLAGASWFVPGSDTGDTLLGRFLDVFAITIFFAVGGHRLVLAAVLDSFAAFPPGLPIRIDDAASGLAKLLDQCLQLAIRGGAPVLFSLLAANLVLGVVARCMPQINLFSVGWGINLIILLAILSFSLGGISVLFHDQLNQSLQTIVAFFQGY